MAASSAPPSPAWIYLRWKKLPVWKIADILAPSIALGSVFGRAGCLLNGCCYGRPCDLPWAIQFPNGSAAWDQQFHAGLVGATGPSLPIHPTEIYDGLLNLILYVFLAWLFRRKKFDGQIFATLPHCLCRFPLHRRMLPRRLSARPHPRRPDLGAARQHSDFHCRPRACCSFSGVAPPLLLRNEDSRWRIEDGKNIPPPSSILHPPSSFLFLAGPTAVGKSAIALALAEQIGGEIISVDSMQVYRGLDIGTAKPTPAERARVPHHLIDVCDLNEAFDAAQFVRLAEKAVAEIQSRGHVPIFCGGTGLYFKAFLEGLGEAPATNPELRAELEAAPL